MNLLIYLVLTVVLLTTIGMPHARPRPRRSGSSSKCVVAGRPPPAREPDDVLPGDAPAARPTACCKPGDEFVSIDGTHGHVLGRSAVAHPGARGQAAHDRRQPRRCATSRCTRHAGREPSSTPTTPPRPRRQSPASSASSPHQDDLLQARADHRRPRPDRQPDAPGRRRLGSYPHKIGSCGTPSSRARRATPTARSAWSASAGSAGEFASSHQLAPAGQGARRC